MKDIAIFVPGLLGSELFDGEGRVWPGDLQDVLTGYSAAKFARLMSPDLRVGNVIRHALGIVNIYDQWIGTLERIERAQSRLFVEGGQSPTLFLFAYDWRKDVREQAAELYKLVARVAADRDAVVTIIAHSLGGVVARYMLQSEGFEREPFAGRVSRLITFGAPHNGTAIAFAGAVGRHKTYFLSRAQSKALASSADFPSLYQLFPRRGTEFIWNRSAEYAAVDPYSHDVCAALGLNVDNLAAALAVQSVLEKKLQPSVRAFHVLGTQQKTLTHFFWNNGMLVPVETENGGDGTVSISGALVDNWGVQFVDQSHINLIGSSAARRTLANLFGADTNLDAAANSVQLSVRDTVIVVEDEVHVVITMEPPGNELRARLILQRARTGAGEPSEGDFVDHAMPESCPDIDYRGPRASLLHVDRRGPELPGIYRVILDCLNPSLGRIVGPSFVVQPQ